jgi:hypothetical protein
MFMKGLEEDQNDSRPEGEYTFLTHATMNKIRNIADVKTAFDAIDADGSG